MTGRPIEDWADLKYAPGTHIAHVFAFGNPRPECHALVDGTSWYGTGCWEEYEHAQSLPICKGCRPDAPQELNEFNAPAPLYVHVET